ncbi:MAG: adenosylcobinamide-GDP ribazoletransferase [Spirochaetales bacterium]|nr:adenosylcobinamide-GDP ribazoletransferase [Spirochaetales bacterium]
MKRTHPLIAAFYFLTSFPGTKKSVPLEDIARGLWAFPLIGLFIGIILSLITLLAFILFPSVLATAIILAAWVWITGALHVDGFIDCCDALLCPRAKRERLAILKDVSAGSFGVTGALLLFIVKYSALSSIPLNALFVLIPLSAVAGRSAMLYVMYRFPYAREEGMGKLFKDKITIKDIMISLVVIFCIAPGCILFHCPFYLGFITPVICLLFSELFGRWVVSRIPGFTGDVYGATCELTEVITLITAASILKAAA